MALNVVEILVRAKNETAGAFAEADATATGFSKALRTSMLVGGLAVAAVGVESLRMATQFQKSMEMLVTQAGVPQSALKTLQTGVLNLAGQVGFSPNSLAESLYHVASNMESMGGTSKQMLGVVKVAAEGARIGGADLVDVTNALTAAVASGIPGVKNYSQAMGILNATVGTGDMKMQDLAEAMSTGVLAIGKQFGLTIRDAGAALATFGDNNIRGAKAGTELRMAIMDLAGQSKAGTAVLAGLGIQAGELGAKMRRGGLLSAVADLRNHLIAAKIPAKEWGAIMMDAFTKKSAAPLAVLLGQFDRLKSKYPALAKAAADFGDAWKKTNDTLAQKLAELRGKFDAVMISIGNKLLPVATRLASWILGTLIPAIGSLTSWLAKHKDAIIAVAVGIMAALVPAFIEWAAAAIPAAAATIVAAAPLILLAAGVALVVFAILDLAKHWKRVWHDIKAWALDGYHAVVGFIERMWRDVSRFAERIWQDVTGFISRMNRDVILFVLRMWNDVTGFFERMWHDVTGFVGRLVNDVLTFFRQLPGKIIGFLASLPGMLFRAGVNAMKGLINGLGSMVSSVGSVVGGIAKKVAGFFGLSPAKEGPLSGGGAPEIRGRHFVQDFARGMTGGLPDLGAAASRMAGMAGPAGPGGYGRPGAPVVVQLQVTGSGTGINGLFIEWLKEQVRIRGGGGPHSVQIALGQGVH